MPCNNSVPSLTTTQSPALSLSRSPSSSNFAPGSHRRSHPHLQQQHLSLAPLTPKYPIDPADYSAYFDPSTSDLHTSTSISHISNLPSPGGILTNSPARSRASSRTRLKRKVKSSVSIVLPDSENHENSNPHPYGALTSQGFGHVLKPIQSRSTTRLAVQTDSSWLVQTGLTLTESSRENKGQSWLSKRDSSTSLASPQYSTVNLASITTSTHDPDHRPRSGRTTPNRSRPSSRSRRSKRALAMTPATTLPDSSALTSPTLHTLANLTEEVQPDWADSATRAEAAAVAASLTSELTSELTDDIDGDDGDPYGVLDFDEHFEPFDSEDEAEMRRELGKHKLGRWIDGVVDVFLRLEEEFPGEDAEGVEKEGGEGEEGEGV